MRYRQNRDVVLIGEVRHRLQNAANICRPMAVYLAHVGGDGINGDQLNVTDIGELLGEAFEISLQ